MNENEHRLAGYGDVTPTEQRTAALAMSSQEKLREDPLRSGLFQVGRIVEKHGQLDAAVSELREIGFGRVRWIQS
jgi:hypothetical protein